MKRALFYIAALIMLASCRQEELPLSEKAVGYLSIDGLSVKVENLDYVSTRAVEPEFYVKIEGNGQTLSYEPGKVPSEIPLEAGSYTVSVYNYEKYQAGEPLYSTKETVEIVAEEINHISMQVPLQNVGVRLELPDDFEEYFTYTFSVSQESSSEPLRDNETYYFESATDGDIIYSMTVTNKEGEKRRAEMETISNPQNGNIYVVKYDYATKSLTLAP